MTFEEFVALRGRRLWRAAFLLTGDYFKAEDLVQTALTKTYGRWSGDAGAFEAYVRKTMYTTYVSWWRRRWNAEVPTAELPETSIGSATPLTSIDVLRALATLPKMQRAVLVLRYFEDRSVDEVARLLGISPGTVKSHASRGCAALRGSTHLATVKEAS